MIIKISREKLDELIENGVRTYYIEKKNNSSVILKDSIMKEIDMFLAFDVGINEDDDYTKALTEGE
ncbi:MAG: hypothetical protein PHF86_13520 [Candidatus Nanoarchaeia archaeon]|jgi:hypothetical protein|nr:hypothetical protein [Candidatus Nanoarchaeia archaeon]